MHRQVVTEVPKKAILVRPSKAKPTIETTKTIEVEEEGRTTSRVVPTSIPWRLDSDVARLIGEAKSLPKSRALRLVEAITVKLEPNFVAWFAAKNGVTLLQFGDVFYLKRKNGNQLGGRRNGVNQRGS